MMLSSITFAARVSRWRSTDEFADGSIISSHWLQSRAQCVKKHDAFDRLRNSTSTCEPGAGLASELQDCSRGAWPRSKTEAAEPASLCQGHTTDPESQAETSAEEGLECLTYQEAAKPVRERFAEVATLERYHFVYSYVNMFEGPVTGNIPEVLDNGEVTDGTRVAAGQLALALTPYAQVTDLAVNTAARRQQRGRHPVPGRQSHRRAGLKAGQQRAGAGDCASCHGGASASPPRRCESSACGATPPCAC